MRRREARPALVLVFVLAAACGSPTSGPSTPARPLSSLKVPQTLAGLALKADPNATKRLLRTARDENSYADDGIVYVLRRDKELMAVLELLLMTPDARPEDRDFRREIVGQIGGREQRPKRIGDALVYPAQGNQQFIYVWFRGRFMSVLIVRDDKAVAGKIDTKRLLAEALRIRP